VTVSDCLGKQFVPVFQNISREYPGHGVITNLQPVPRHVETGAPPSTVYRYAHHEAVRQYQQEGIPKNTYFSIEQPDDRYRASDHQLISVPYSDQYFRSSLSSTGAHYVATTGPMPSDQMTKHRW